MRHKRRSNLPGDASDPAYDISIPDNLLEGLACCDPEEWAESADAPELVSLIASLREAAQPHELRGEAAALAAFKEAGLSASGQPRPRLLAWRASRRTTLVAAALVGSVGLGTAAAAFEGELPAPLQQVAHVLFGLPAPDSDDDSTGAEREETPSDVPHVSNQGVTQQTPSESTQDIVVTNPDGLAPVTVAEETSKDNKATEADESEADEPTPMSPASADDTPAEPKSGPHSGSPEGEEPLDEGDEDGPADDPQGQAEPPQGEHQQSKAAPKPTSTPGPSPQPTSGRPAKPGPPANAGAATDPGPPSEAGAPAAVEPPAPEPQPGGGPPSESPGPPPATPNTRAQPPAKP